MTAKEYLRQIRSVDKRIKNKLEMVEQLRDTATNATATLSDMPRSDSPNLQRMEDTICKIVDLENEISEEINRLVALKRETQAAIDALPSFDEQMVLELRYLCCKSWPEIMTELGYSETTVYRMHNQALEKFVVPENSGVNAIERELSSVHIGTMEVYR